jgi:transposase
MFYVGLDIHSKQIAMCVLDQHGKLVERLRLRSTDEMLLFLRRLPQCFDVRYEASCGYGFYHDLLRPLARRVLVAHPAHLRLIFRSKKKNDRNDAERLAKLLFLGEVPAVHVPQVEVRVWRELITSRRYLVQKRTRAKNGLRALLRGLGIRAPARPGLWTKQGREWLRALALPNSGACLRRDLLLDEVDHLSGQLARLEKELNQRADQSPAVFTLLSIPGVGVRTAEAFVAFLDNPHRFKNSKHVASYFGLVPSQDQSGDVNRLGHITRQGSPVVRQLVTEAVWQSQRRSPTVRAYLERIQRGDRDRKKIAVVATGHYLVRVMFKLLKTGELWRETEAAA